MGGGVDPEHQESANAQADSSFRFWARVQDHKIIQWGLAYLGAALAIAHGAELVGHAFHWSDVVGRVLMLVLIAGLPLVLTLAWYHGHRGFRSVSAGELGILSVLILIGAVFFTAALRPSDGAVAHGREGANTAAPSTAISGDPVPQNVAPSSRPANSIAVLPLTNISSDAEQEYFVDGLSEELMNQLAQVRALRVTARTSSFAFKGKTETVEKIGEQLNVAHVLEGSVRKAGNQLVITAQLIDTTSGFHLWSHSYNRELSDIFAIQQDIAREVVRALRVTLGLNEDQRMAGGTDNLDAYALYLAGNARDRSSVVQAAAALEQIEQALELDPNFALAWAQKANITLFLRNDPRRNGAELQATAEDAGRRAVELAPDSAVAHAVMASAASSRGDWVQAEAKYREVLARGDPAERGGGYGLLLLVVGHGYEARERLLLQQQRDPLNNAAVAFLAAAEDGHGNTRGAIAEYERGLKLFQPWTAGYYNIMLTQAGIPDTSLRDRLRENPAVQGFTFADPAFAPILANWDEPAAARDAVRSAYAALDEAVMPLWRVLARLQMGALAARFGDPELALTAFEETFSSGPQQIYAIWRPVFRDMRKLPSFKKFAREIGLVDYWREYGWPDTCRRVGENDFECD
jgi:TolB-like protein